MSKGSIPPKQAETRTRPAIPRRKKLILIGLAAALASLALASYILWRSYSHNQVVLAADAEFARGAVIYDQAARQRDQHKQAQEPFETSLGIFKSLADNVDYCRETPLTAGKADVMCRLAQANLALLKQTEESFPAADKHLQEVYKLLAQLRSKGATHDFLSLPEEEADALDWTLRAREKYDLLVKQAMNLAKAGEVTRAHEALRSLANRSNLSPRQFRQIEDLHAIFDNQHAYDNLAKLTDDAEALRKAHQYEHAIGAYRRILEAVAAKEFSPLPQSVRDEAASNAQAQIQRLEGDKRLDDMVSVAEELEMRGKTLEAAKEYERILYSGWIPNALHARLTEKARQLREKAGIPAATGPSRREIEDSLEKMREFRTLWQEADQAAEARQWDSAIAKYEKVRELAQPEAVESVDRRLGNAKSARDAEKGDAAAAAKDWATAQQLYHRAIEFRPSAEEAIGPRLRDVEVHLRAENARKQYDRFVKAAITDIDKNAWADALTEIEKARIVNPDKESELKDLSDEVRYRQYLAAGREALESRDYKTATACLGLAKKYKTTPELEQLIKKAAEGLKDQN